jgi:hypothetical protein
MEQHEIDELRDRVARLEAMLAAAAPAIAAPESDRDRSDDGAGTSRRGLLRGLAAAAAGGAVAAVVASSGDVAAADPFDLTLGAWNTVSSALTETDYTGSTSGASFLFQSGTALTPGNSAFTARSSALTGATTQAVHPTGVVGYSEVSTGTGVWAAATGTTGVGLRAEGPSAVVATSTTSTGTAILGTGTNGYGVRGVSTDSVGVVGNSTNSTGVFGAGLTGARGEGADAGVHGEGLVSGTGVRGHAAGGGAGVAGVSVSGIGVTGDGPIGVQGTATTGIGVQGEGYYALVGHSNDGYGLLAQGMYGGVVSGQYGLVCASADSALIMLRPATRTAGDRVAPPSRTDAHLAGELDLDANYDVWLCTADGTPGTWRKIGGRTTAGAFHAITPGRVYDSRLDQPSPAARLSSGEERTISVRDQRALTNGAVTLADLVPAGATAISANVAVVDTIGAGFLCANPGGVHTIGAATVNWWASGQILNNGVILTLDASRQLNLIVGGGGSAHIVVDVTGYFR